MMSEYNRQGDRIYPLNEKGYRQAQRNNSHQIWTLLSWEEQTNCSFNDRPQPDENIRAATPEQPIKPLLEDQIKQEDKGVSFKLSKNDEEAEVKQQKQNKSIRENTFIRSKPERNLEAVKEQPAETQLQKLKRKSIEKYIKDLTPYTRTLSNSAFRKLYQRPCPEAYGRTNTQTERGAFYGNFMKTHNIQPHTLDNQPVTYQTYTSALNHGKRTKLDLEDRWKRIERQLAKNLDYRELAYMKAVGEIDVDDSNKEELLKTNIDVAGQKQARNFQVATLNKSSKSLGRMETIATFQNTAQSKDLRSISAKKRQSKSSDKPLYFIYKYKQQDEDYNCTRYARDRHGITCYVDNCFRQNDEAFRQFQRNIKKIHPEKCKPEDVNIDNIRIENCKQAKDADQIIPRHYLMPNVQIPYSAQNYSRKRQKSMTEAVV